MSRSSSILSSLIERIKKIGKSAKRKPKQKQKKSGGLLLGVGAGLGFGSSSGSSPGSSPTSGVSGVSGGNGTAGRAARSGMTGGASLPSIRAASKPSVSENMNINQLLNVAIGYLASIDQTLKDKLKTQRSIFSQQQLSGREASAESQSSPESASSSFSNNMSTAGNSLMSAALPGLILAGVTLSKTPGFVNSLIFAAGAVQAGKFLVKGFVKKRLQMKLKELRAAGHASVAAKKIAAEAVQRAAVRTAAVATANYTRTADGKFFSKGNLAEMAEAKYTRTADGKFFSKNGTQLYGAALRSAEKHYNANGPKQLYGAALESSKNQFKAATDATADATAAAAKVTTAETAVGVARKGATVAMKKVLSKVPGGIGTLISFYFAYDYYKSGDYGKAALTALAGIASFFPGVGTAIAIALDAAVIGMEILDAKKNNTNTNSSAALSPTTPSSTIPPKTDKVTPDSNPGSMSPTTSSGTSTLNKSLLDSIKSFEGFSFTSYWDGSQYSIGYGTKAQGPDEEITKEEAERRLEKDVADRRNYVVQFASKHGYKWNSDQIDALTSFVYNLGTDKLAQVTADGTRTNDEIANKMLEYVNAGGNRIAGLVRRRQDESARFKRGNSEQNLPAHEQVASATSSDTTTRIPPSSGAPSIIPKSINRPPVTLTAAAQQPKGKGQLPSIFPTPVMLRDNIDVSASSLYT